MTTTSSTSAPSPSVAVTADGLAHALDKMGLTESVSAALLYDTIRQLQSEQPSPQPQTTGDSIPQTAKEGSSDQPRKFDPMSGPERRRKLREMFKASWH